MKKLCIAFLFLLISISTNAQTPSWLWAKSAEGGDDDRALSTATDGQDIYITGFFSSSVITFGSTTLTNPGMFLAKYNALGNVLWAQGASNNNLSQGNAVATDNSGNIYVAGYFYATGGPTITFGSFTLTHPGLFIVKYDLSGNVIWAKDAISSGSRATAIAVDNLGNIFVGGIPGDTLIVGSDTLFPSDNYDRFIAKYDTAGNPLWARGLATGGYIENVDAPFIAADKFGNVYVTGSFHINACVIVTTTLINQGDDNIYLAKFNGAGNLLWAKSYGGSGHDDGTSVAVDTSGNIYITGYYTDLSITFSPLTLTGAGVGCHIYIVKLDSAGNALWADKVKNLAAFYPVKITTDRNQEVYITGYWGSSSALVFTPTDSLVNTGLFLAKYNSNGNFKWARDASGGGRATGVAVDSSGNPYITGYFSADTLSFDANTIYNTDSAFSVFVAAMNTLTSVEKNNATTEISLSVYPNPSAGKFYILTDQDKPGTVVIYDALGKEILSKRIDQKIEWMDLSSQPKGIYFLSISIGNIKQSKKIIIY